MASISLPQITNGIIRSATIDDTLAPQNTCSFALNGHFDSIGSFTTRKGIKVLGATVEANKAILGMTNYINNAGTNYKLLAMADTDVYSYNGTSWSSVRGSLTAGSKARFTNFVDYTFMVNGNGNEVCATYNGAGSFGATNVASLPKGDFIENYRSRIWVADSATDKLYYSDVVNTDNTITGGASFLQISPQDGESITGLKRYSRALLVFKQNHIYRVYSINSADPDPYINRGTYSQESIVEAKDGIYYHHSSGFYKFVEGDQIEISLPIRDIVEAIPRAYWPNVSGWTDDDHIYWSVGDITLDGKSYSNMVVRYTISTQIWTTYTYGSEIRTGGTYDNGTIEVNVVGDDLGVVSTFDSGNTDNSTEIHYDLQTHWYYLSDNKHDRKSITEAGVLHENANGATLSYRKDVNRANKWIPLGQIKDDIFQKRPVGEEFIKIKLRINGSTVGSPLKVLAWELIDVK